MASSCADHQPFPLQIPSLKSESGQRKLDRMRTRRQCRGRWGLLGGSGMHALKSESGRVAMEGKISLVLPYATESLIVLHQSVSAFQSVRTWSKLRSCSFVLKTESYVEYSHGTWTWTSEDDVPCVMGSWLGFGFTADVSYHNLSRVK
jgi:hypothetical protein